MLVPSHGDTKVSYPLRLTNRLDMDLKIEMWDFLGNYRVANYDTFKLAENENYTLAVDGFWTENRTFTLDAFGRLANGMKFSTYDHDNDDEIILTCAKEFRAPGWLFMSLSWP